MPNWRPLTIALFGLTVVLVAGGIVAGNTDAYIIAAVLLLFVVPAAVVVFLTDARARQAAQGGGGSTAVEPILVTAGILERDGSVLIARRRRGVRRGLLWELPGGKVDAGETPEAALARELYEELGVTVAVGERVGTSLYRYPDQTVELLAYRVALQAGEPTAFEHEELRWVRPRELRNFEFAPADLPIVGDLMRGGTQAVGH
ncbi:MAG TPA: (deoxy)nucleoside triphosphate pyrophosphohydrolase [Ktedonobacterales bacterium]|jgi:8-oxo-dGTP diphosphatase